MSDGLQPVHVALLSYARSSMPSKPIDTRCTETCGSRTGCAALKEEFSLAIPVVRARSRANLTQAELAERMGTSTSTVVCLETVEPGLPLLKDLAEASRMPRPA